MKSRRDPFRKFSPIALCILISLVISSLLTFSQITGSKAGLSVQAAETQRVMFKFAHQKATYDLTDSDFNSAIPNLPSNWSTPVDYAGGNIYYKMTVTGKPTNMEVVDQLCFRTNDATKATCSSPPNVPYSTNRTFYRKLPSMATWWSIGGFDINQKFDIMQMTHSDSAWKPLWLEQCGTQCYTGPLDLHQHMPFYYDIEAIMVAKDSTLARPADWADCPVDICGAGTVTIPPIDTTIAPTAVPPTAVPTTPASSCPASKPKGDANCDGVTTLADYIIWRNEYMGIDTKTDADFNGDGVVTLADFIIWRNGYTQ